MGTAATQRGSGARSCSLSSGVPPTFDQIDHGSGTTYRAHTGLRLGNDNHGAPVTIGPDVTAYLGSILGLLAARDR